MAKPTLTCARCGKAMVQNKGSRPQGEATCHPCRRDARGLPPKARKPTDTRSYHERKAERETAKTCAVCGVQFVPKGAWRTATCCSHRCAARKGNAPHQARHPDDLRLLRQQRERDAPGLNDRQRKALLDKWRRQRRTCAYCPRPVDTIDHVIALVRGGTNHEGNLLPCCRPCNGSKSSLLIIEWRTGKRLGPSSRILPWTYKIRPQRKIKYEVQTLFTLADCTRCGVAYVKRSNSVTRCDGCRTAVALEQRRASKDWGNKRTTHEPKPCAACGNALVVWPRKQCDECNVATRRAAKRRQKQAAKRRRELMLAA